MMTSSTYWRSYDSFHPMIPQRSLVRERFDMDVTKIL
jgi:hypothetical protein